MKRVSPVGGWLVVAIALLLVAGCGGGSVGTGTEPGKTTQFFGSVTSPAGQPVAGAIVSLLESDTSAVVGDDGSFAFDAEFAGGDANFRLEALGKEADFVVTAITPGTEAVEVNVVYDSNSNSVVLSNLSLRAKIVGECDKYFVNRQPIIQTDPVPDGTRCDLEVSIRSNNQPVDGLQFEVEHRACTSGSSWGETTSGTTGNRAPGVGKVRFLWKNDADHCVYRIRGPVGIPDLDERTVHINTLRKLAFDAGTPFPDDGDPVVEQQ